MVPHIISTLSSLQPANKHIKGRPIKPQFEEMAFSMVPPARATSMQSSLSLFHATWLQDGSVRSSVVYRPCLAHLPRNRRSYLANSTRQRVRELSSDTPTSVACTPWATRCWLTFAHWKTYLPCCVIPSLNSSARPAGSSHQSSWRQWLMHMKVVLTSEVFSPGQLLEIHVANVEQVRDNTAV